MKKLTALMSITMLLLSTAILLTDCKKKETAIVPAFIVTSQTVTLQGGGLGLQFYAKCSNDDVKMTKVTITDPLQSGNITYNLNAQTYVKDEIFQLQDATTAYTKESGTWKFNFVGNRSADGTSFAVDAYVSVAGK